jgi:stage V sporulation protein SpoVS
LVPSVVVANILAVPVETAETSPDEFTVAIAVLLDDHERVLLTAFDGATVAVICCVRAIAIDTVLGLTDILETGMGTVVDARYAAKLVP